MTDRAKENILKYLSGKITPETEVNEPQFEYGGSISAGIETYLDSELTDWLIKGQLEYQDKIVIYGNHRAGVTTDYGFILLLDSNFDILQLLTEYSSGTAISYFHILNIDEDGLFYGVDYNGTNTRFILLNNFCIKSILATDYSVKLRNSYYMTGNYNLSLFTEGTGIFKKNGEAKYAIVSPSAYTGSNITEIVVTTLKINVGIANEWDYYKPTVYNQIVSLYDTFIEFNEDYYNLAYIGLDNSDNLVLYTFYSPGSGSGIFQYNYYSNGLDFAKIISINLMYAISKGTSLFVIYKINSGSMSILYRSEDYIYNLNSFELVKKNDNIFIFFSTSVGGSNYHFYLVQINENDVYEYAGSRLYSIPDFFYVKQNYNLIELYYGDLEFLYKTNEIFNTLNYNGESYEAENFLIPNNMALYDESNYLIYARNLYNLVVDDNSTVATIEIPNTYLNDVTIENKDLLSETNQTISQDTSLLVKNIYENVLLNFYNNLYMKKGSVYNLTGAIKLNESFNEDDQYDNAKITKYKLIYDDDTYDIRNIDTITITDGVADLEMYFYLNKELTKLQILSNDETTVYCESTITGINKFYKVNQKVEVI